MLIFWHPAPDRRKAGAARLNPAGTGDARGALDPAQQVKRNRLGIIFRGVAHSGVPTAAAIYHDTMRSDDRRPLSRRNSSIHLASPGRFGRCTVRRCGSRWRAALRRRVIRALDVHLGVLDRRMACEKRRRRAGHTMTSDTRCRSRSGCRRNRRRTGCIVRRGPSHPALVHLRLY
jgi:hypothetical protein